MCSACISYHKWLWYQFRLWVWTSWWVPFGSTFFLQKQFSPIRESSCIRVCSGHIWREYGSKNEKKMSINLAKKSHKKSPKIIQKLNRLVICISNEHLQKKSSSYRLKKLCIVTKGPFIYYVTTFLGILDRLTNASRPAFFRTFLPKTALTF